MEKFTGEVIELVKLRNPLCKHSEYVGPWCAGSPEWLEVLQSDRERLRLETADSEFWMPYSEFIKTFTHIELVHLDNETSKDEPSLRNKNTWQMRLLQGHWLKGVSAGGCRNNPETFHINPQLHLLLNETEEVVISLSQHSITEPKVIGFTAYWLPNYTTESLGRTFFKKNKSLVNSQYTNSRHVSINLHFFIF